LAIISGDAEPTEEEIAAAESDDESDDEEDEARVTEINDDADSSSADVKGVPEFWLTALQNHRPVAEQITERDEEALRSLTDIRLSYLENSNQPGFKLHFIFAPNDFFENTELVKTYYYQEKVGYGGDFVYDKAEGCEIQWKEDKDLTKKVEIKKQKNKSLSLLSLWLLADFARHEQDEDCQEDPSHRLVLQLLQAPSTAIHGGP
jgi:nucleosome assembly protein 1-like 1